MNIIIVLHIQILRYINIKCLIITKKLQLPLNVDICHKYYKKTFFKLNIWEVSCIFCGNLIIVLNGFTFIC